ncbi:MAG: hypothetical protein CMN57_11435 [Gammaproteobacteria bacterium]|nr:hypothetical protein [Gammaproteobacteria bacterium]
MIDLAQLGSPWLTIIQRVNNGKRVDRQEVIDLLNSDEPVHDAAKPFLAAVIEGEYKFKRGIKPRTIPPWMAEAVLAAAKTLERKRGETAKDTAADMLGISVRQLENLLQQARPPKK